MPPLLVCRCLWAAGDDPANPLLHYHDDEWCRPSRDERHLFELLSLEGAQVRIRVMSRLRLQPSIGFEQESRSCLITLWALSWHTVHVSVVAFEQVSSTAVGTSSPAVHIRGKQAMCLVRFLC